MCWLGESNKKRITQGDRVVYKFSTGVDSETFVPHYFSDSLGYYAVNEANPRVHIKVKRCNGYTFPFSIEEGYHSYVNIESIRFDHPNYFLSVGIFIIPKGTVYYINEDGEIVSENLIYTGVYQNICELNYWNIKDQLSIKLIKKYNDYLTK